MTRKPRITPQYLRLRKINSREWIDSINKIPDRRLRYKIAAIIWWDWFSFDSRKCRELKCVSRMFKDSYHYAGMEEDIYCILIYLGYSEKNARKRSKIPRSGKPKEK